MDHGAGCFRGGNRDQTRGGTLGKARWDLDGDLRARDSSPVGTQRFG
ncbi:hypothetical protein [Alteribacillus iranensis]|nr:hypothetical protein [Alteribacillus iranensis]